MGANKLKRSLLIFGGLVLAIAAGVSIWLFSEAEYLRIKSPDGEYTAVVTYRRLELYRPTFPGQSGDKSGYIRIEDSEGANYGKIPVGMVSMSRDLEWTEEGADLTMVGEWNFSKREYRYWNDAQTKEYVKKAK